MIRGSAVDTTVPARTATSMPIIRPEMAWVVCRGVRVVVVAVTSPATSPEMSSATGRVTRSSS